MFFGFETLYQIVACVFLWVDVVGVLMMRRTGSQTNIKGRGFEILCVSAVYTLLCCVVMIVSVVKYLGDYYNLNNHVFEWVVVVASWCYQLSYVGLYFVD